MSLTHPRTVQETPSVYTSSDSTGGSGLEGGRNTGVHYSMKVQLDQELYMTEYAAIRIVFTRQGLYTSTHSPHHPPIRRPTNSGAPINETNDYGTILLPVWGASSRERLPGAVKQSIMKSPWILRSRAKGVLPTPPDTETLSSCSNGAARS